MDNDVIAQIKRLSQQFAYTSLQMHESIARKAGFSGTDHKYLGFLLQKEQMTAGELAKLSGLTTGAITGLIDRFEKKKLVKRKFAEDDRRKVFIEPITKNIMSLMQPLYKEFRSESERLLASFSDKELKVLEKYFSRATEIMSETTNQLNRKESRQK
jgi:DNA-binding MarR family transcriptional regulator